ncbi:hypothetical protein JCM9152_714 [Halalkalibacter hemicellulosilyticusJCM 9152]|uniref:DUF3006 domain-containing protein n=2 Tax=Halalkalibacter TaxID=2893056 RepID=W4QBD0_9BACI|nr:hypothetical protein JCM9152_714 [Halalkalibacter hemicellulosilyticusJCM 9152]
MMESTKCIIDRFEGSWAVLEWNRETFDFPADLLPEGCQEGDVLSIRFERLEDETAIRKKNIQKLADKLFRDDN